MIGMVASLSDAKIRELEKAATNPMPLCVAQWEQGWLPALLVHRGKGRDPLCCSHSAIASSVGRWREEGIMPLHGHKVMLTACATTKRGVY